MMVTLVNEVTKKLLYFTPEMGICKMYLNKVVF